MTNPPSCAAPERAHAARREELDETGSELRSKAIDVSQPTLEFGTRTAVPDVSFSVTCGEVFVMCSPPDVNLLGGRYVVKGVRRGGSTVRSGLPPG
jgi:hypothetical protein